MTRDEKKMLKIATYVRSELEDARHDPKYQKDFGYKPRWDLGGFCGIASDMIVRRARKAGIRDASDVMCQDWGHTFVRWRDWIIDVTATQFNNRRPRVCMVDLRKRRHPLPEYWQEYKGE